MARLVKVAATGDLEKGQGKVVDAEGVPVALFHIDGQFHAVANECPHRGGPLGEGSLAGTQVICPWHGWQFDVVSGACTTNPEARQTTYPVHLKGDEILIEI
ncbi:MAG: non-heme iron oxygenase ferredoxin subunit [Omnitrophica bacterium RIFCSPHIGHO2_02_FULL_49_9]|nr:MAG: non-heme iron oxygenase ferredoxin subunit [Omnitrophica bacterium RIFCSPHIGHO2_02_FULL_49_9]OGW89419.1 MAG: non-heme iron oxygenase ferredoxin subunit [Omnitrophica bacterium RIFCSPLOWO2_01_FULL_50_24]